MFPTTGGQEVVTGEKVKPEEDGRVGQPAPPWPSLP